STAALVVIQKDGIHLLTFVLTPQRELRSCVVSLASVKEIDYGRLSWNFRPRHHNSSDTGGRALQRPVVERDVQRLWSIGQFEGDVHTLIAAVQAAAANIPMDTTLREPKRSASRPMQNYPAA